MASNSPYTLEFYDSISMSAINISSRLKLSQVLNIIQPLLNSKGICRDYRGLAEQMNFDHLAIQSFQRCEDPTEAVLKAWQTRDGSSVGALLRLVEELERFDVLTDILPLFERNVQTYLKMQEQSVVEQPLQVSEISSCKSDALLPYQQNQLSVNDTLSSLAYYDAYICFAQKDIEFAMYFTEQLELAGVKLFIKERDLQPGLMEHDALARVIKERCQRVLVILSPDFVESPECDFQAKYAQGLAIEELRIRIIPIIYKKCMIPPIISCLSKVDFSHKSLINKWGWDKIIGSINAARHHSFVHEVANALPPPTDYPNAIMPSEEDPNDRSTEMDDSYYPPVIEMPVSSLNLNHLVDETQPSSSRHHSIFASPVRTRKTRWYHKRPFSSSKSHSRSNPEVNME